MSELKWAFGYPFAIVLMLLSAVLPYLCFRRISSIGRTRSPWAMKSPQAFSETHFQEYLPVVEVQSADLTVEVPIGRHAHGIADLLRRHPALRVRRFDPYDRRHRITEPPSSIFRWRAGLDGDTLRRLAAEAAGSPLSDAEGSPRA